METTNEDDVIDTTADTQSPPKLTHDNGHDNRVFADDSDQTQMPHATAYHPNGHHTNGNGHPPQTFRIIENSRL